MRTLSKRKNPAAAEQRVMSLQNLLRSRFLSQKSKSLLQTPAAPTKEEMLIKVIINHFLIVLKLVTKYSKYLFISDLEFVCAGAKFGTTLDSWDEVEIPQTPITRQASRFKLAKKNGLQPCRLL